MKMTRSPTFSDRERHARAAQAQVDEMVERQVMPPGCTWIETRRAMLRIMAEAFQIGDMTIDIVEGGTLAWSKNAYISRNRRWPAPLAVTEAEAAIEIEKNLGNPAFRHALESGTRADNGENLARLRVLATAIYGDEWISPLSRDINVALRTVQRWAAAEVAVPVWLVAKLPAMALTAMSNGTVATLEKRVETIRKFAATDC